MSTVAILMPDLRIGGAERVVLKIANELVRRQHRVDLVLLRAEGELLASLSPSVRIVNLRASRVRNVLWPLQRYLHTARPDAVLACMWPLTVLAILAGKLARTRARIVVAEHTTWSQSETASWHWHYLALRLSMRSLFPLAAARIAVSEGAADDLAAITGLPRTCICVPTSPIIDETAPSPRGPCAAAARWWAGPQRRVLAVGSLKPVKDYPTLLRAFARLRQDTDARLLILGDGPSRPELEQLARELGIVDALDMPGFVDDTTPYYHRAELHVLSSRVEGLPTVMIEALAAGTPVVSTDCRSGPREILQGGRLGRLVPVGDAVALAAAMADALAGRSNAVELRQRAMHFSVARSVDQYEPLLLGTASDTPELAAGQAMRRVLYVSYDGVMEPLGQSQVLAYLRQLAPNTCIHLLSYEKPADWQDHARLDRTARLIAEAGIRWHPLRYHKHPTTLATSFDIMVGIMLGLWLVLRHDLRIVHARSYVPGTIALVLKRLTGARFLFDMRGFWADERVDGGLWAKDSRLYRIAKSMERRLLLGADHVVSLTRTAACDIAAFEYLRGRTPRLSVIPTCTDVLHFRAPGQAQEGFVLGYVGSAGTWYLLDEAIACFLCLRELRPDARLLIVNRGEHALINERLRQLGAPAAAVELKSASHAEMPLEMARMHAAVFMIKPVFSKRASAPTKLGELLACGVPCLGNAGVGDMESVLEGERVGVVLRRFDAAARMEAVEHLLRLCADSGLRGRCVETAHRHFSLDQGVASYGAIYAGLGRPA